MSDVLKSYDGKLLRTPGEPSVEGEKGYRAISCGAADDYLIVGGFSAVGSRYADNAAFAKGRVWYPMADPRFVQLDPSWPRNNIVDMEVFQGQIIVCGEIRVNLSGSSYDTVAVASWNNELKQFEALGNSGFGPGEAFDDFQTIRCMTVFGRMYDDDSNAVLLVGGDAGGEVSVLGYDGASWAALSGGDVPLIATCFHIWNDVLYAGDVGTAAGGVGISRWSGTPSSPLVGSWSAFGDVIVASHVAAMAHFDDGTGEKLYAGGHIYNVTGLGDLNPGGNRVHGIVRFTEEGDVEPVWTRKLGTTSGTRIISGFDHAADSTNRPVCLALQVFNGRLYYTGGLHDGGGGQGAATPQPGSPVGYWDGVKMQPCPTALVHHYFDSSYAGVGYRVSGHSLAVIEDPYGSGEQVLACVGHFAESSDSGYGTAVNYAAKFIQGVDESENPIDGVGSFEPVDPYGFDDIVTCGLAYNDVAYVGGYFTSSGATVVRRFAKRNAGVDQLWTEAAAVNGPVETMALVTVLSAANIVLGGRYTIVGNNTAAVSLARYAPSTDEITGIGDVTFSGSPGTVRRIRPGSEADSILLCGLFDSLPDSGGPLTSYHIGKVIIGSTVTSVALNTDTMTGSISGPGVIHDFIVHDGYLYIVGDFVVTVGANTMRYVARRPVDGNDEPTGDWQYLVNSSSDQDNIRGTGRRIAVYDGKIYVSSESNSTIRNVRIFDPVGVAWANPTSSPYNFRTFFAPDRAPFMTTVETVTHPDDGPGEYLLLDYQGTAVPISTSTPNRAQLYRHEAGGTNTDDRVLGAHIDDLSVTYATTLSVFSGAIRAAFEFDDGDGDKLHVFGEFRRVGDTDSADATIGPAVNAAIFKKDMTALPFLGGAGDRVFAPSGTQQSIGRIKRLSGYTELAGEIVGIAGICNNDGHPDVGFPYVNDLATIGVAMVTDTVTKFRTLGRGLMLSALNDGPGFVADVIKGTDDRYYFVGDIILGLNVQREETGYEPAIPAIVRSDYAIAWDIATRKYIPLVGGLPLVRAKVVAEWGLSGGQPVIWVGTSAPGSGTVEFFAWKYTTTETGEWEDHNENFDTATDPITDASDIFRLLVWEDTLIALGQLKLLSPSLRYQLLTKATETADWAAMSNENTLGILALDMDVIDLFPSGGSPSQLVAVGNYDEDLDSQSLVYYRQNVSGSWTPLGPAPGEEGAMHQNVAHRLCKLVAPAFGGTTVAVFGELIVIESGQETTCSIAIYSKLTGRWVPILTDEDITATTDLMLRSVRDNSLMLHSLRDFRVTEIVPNVTPLFPISLLEWNYAEGFRMLGQISDVYGGESDVFYGINLFSLRAIDP